MSRYERMREDIIADRDRLQRALEAAERWLKTAPIHPPAGLMKQIADALNNPPDSAGYGSAP